MNCRIELIVSPGNAILRFRFKEELVAIEDTDQVEKEDLPGIMGKSGTATIRGRKMAHWLHHDAILIIVVDDRLRNL